MKLNIVPARTGTRWARDGVRTFFKQPLAILGLFFMFVVSISLVALIPFVGGVLALVLVPAATVGLMAAAREADAGRFPMPLTLAVALRQGPQPRRAILILGAFYAVAVMVAMGVSAMIDGGRFAELYVGGGGITEEMIQDASFRTAMWAFTLLYLPISIAFWHAPALVHWHGVSPLKSLFFSTVAVFRNLGAFFLYGLMWMAMSFAAGLVLVVIAAITGSASIATFGLMPIAIMVASMFFSSLWFTFRDSFTADQELSPVTS
ncbi:BPSS1780 family membrane protein [Ottowia thiooxydans]|uniref:MFS family permease n=1 Tax=Ottowia thiooxydans TaxID=219182 RepID=A0ABV2Q6N5_9BURK